MKIALAQYPITKHETLASWKNHVRQWIQSAVEQKAQVLVFPEYGSMELVSLMDQDAQSSLQIQVEKMTEMAEEFVLTYSKLAQEFSIAILAPSLPIKVASFAKPVNRAYFCYPDGRVEFQDKEHMTRFEDESWGVGPGEVQNTVFEYAGVKFGVNICFDVEFPFAAADLAKNGVQVLLAPSCTETMKGMNRVHIGARARALENQFYVAVAQTVGDAPWSLAVDVNTGQAAVYSTCDWLFPDDGILVQGPLNEATWVFADLDLQLITDVREDGQVFNFRHMQKHL